MTYYRKFPLCCTNASVKISIVEHLLVQAVEVDSVTLQPFQCRRRIYLLDEAPQFSKTIGTLVIIILRYRYVLTNNFSPKAFIGDEVRPSDC